jgi:hypothetical protein
MAADFFITLDPETVFSEKEIQLELYDYWWPAVQNHFWIWELLIWCLRAPEKGHHHFGRVRFGGDLFRCILAGRT